jgi:hypothetical protein
VHHFNAEARAFPFKKILRRSQGHVHHYFNAEARAFPFKKNT